MNKETFSIYDALDAIRSRPGMHIGGETLELLGTYITGYYAAMEAKGIEDVGKPDFCGFNEFVRGCP